MPSVSEKGFLYPLTGLKSPSAEVIGKKIEAISNHFLHLGSGG
jgi:hypothetical protein